jgi:NAD(P)H-hydrate epimerase
MKVSTVAEMRNLDKGAIETFKIPDLILMENAGEAVYFVINNEFGIEGKRFTIFCGIGNNGGDGFVVARKLHSNGGQVKVFLLGDKAKLTGCAKDNFDMISALPIDIHEFSSVEQAQFSVSHCDAIIDALFGTGLVRDVGGTYRGVIELINQSQKTVFSIDIPSGVNGDTGQVMGCAVRADYTVTFGLPKRGNLLFPGFDLCGKLYVTHISFPPSHYNADTIRKQMILCHFHKGRRIPTRVVMARFLLLQGPQIISVPPIFLPCPFLRQGEGSRIWPRLSQ